MAKVTVYRPWWTYLPLVHVTYMGQLLKLGFNVSPHRQGAKRVNLYTIYIPLGWQGLVPVDYGHRWAYRTVSLGICWGATDLPLIDFYWG